MSLNVFAFWNAQVSVQMVEPTALSFGDFVTCFYSLLFYMIFKFFYTSFKSIF